MIAIFVISAINKPYRNRHVLAEMTPEENPRTDQSMPNLTLLEEKNRQTRVRIRVLNGCGVSGIAFQIKETLVEEGIDVIETANADHFDYEKTIMYLHTDSYSRTKFVADALGIPNHPVMDNRSPDYHCDMTIIIGKDYSKLKPIKRK